MTFFCPIFPKNRLKAKEYEDSNVFSMDDVGRKNNFLYSSRSMTALNLVPASSPREDDDSNNRKSMETSRLILVISDFEPTVDDELRVRKGDVVRAVYRDRDWVYVAREDEGEGGFIPMMYCRYFDSSIGNNKHHRHHRKNHHRFDRSSSENKKQKKNSGKLKSSVSLGEKERKNSDESSSDQKQRSGHGQRRNTVRPEALVNVDRFLRSLEEENKKEIVGLVAAGDQDSSKINTNRKSLAGPPEAEEKETNEISYGSIVEFRKNPRGRLVAEFDFVARRQDDASIKQGDLLLLLNNDDPDWYWIKKKNGEEGFVPSNYVRRIPANSADSSTENEENVRMMRNNETAVLTGQIPFNELIVSADFEPEAADDLRVMKGDWIYSYSTSYDTPGWLWAYSTRTKRYGFVPSSVVRLPEATML